MPIARPDVAGWREPGKTNRVNHACFQRHSSACVRLFVVSRSLTFFSDLPEGTRKVYNGQITNEL